MLRMDLANKKYAVTTPLKGLLVASLLPILGLSLTSPEIMLFVILIAVPFSLFCMALIGAPLYFLLKRYRLLNFPLCIVAGVLCSVPGSIVFSPSDLPIEFSLSNYISFSLIGGVGGCLFWAIYARVFGKEQRKIGSVFGFVIVASFSAALSYASQFKTIEYVDGKTLTKGVSFVESNERLVPIKVEGEQLMVRLAEQVPYICNCEVILAKWRDMFTHETKYSLTHYPQVPRAHHYNVLSEEDKAKVPRDCPNDGKVLIF